MNLILFFVFICLLILVYNVLSYIVRAIYNFPKLKQEIKELKEVIKEDKRKIREINKTLDLKVNQVEGLKAILSLKNPFSIVSSLIADALTVVYDEERRYMISKKRPAYNSAQIVSQLKQNTQDYVEKYKTMLYKYEFLISTFPELKTYVDDEEALLSLSKENSYQDFKENRDKSMDYLTMEEWSNLSENQRNQLALDRYKKRPKSNWTIGMLYEMYIGYLLREQYDVIQFGIINGVEDLGRDIIATKKYADGRENIYIIQCKNWSLTKEIHENIVCQIFGSAMEFDIKNRKSNQKVVPVLCVTTELSHTAKIFADRLGVEVYVKPMGDFPMIKCNINNGNKIYHLPFDQQYWRTKIEKPGEFYAWTVEEAVHKGFRRALRHFN